MRIVALLAVLAISCFAQNLKDCRTVFVAPMPESMDQFVSAELVNWGVMKVVTVEEKADCVAAFGRRQTKVEVRSTGSSVVPNETTVTSEQAEQKLPRSFTGVSVSKNAAMQLIHRESTAIIWAASKTDTWSMAGGAKTLARKLVDQLKKDYKKAGEVRE